MFEFILGITSRTYFFMRRFMPTAIVIDAINGCVPSSGVVPGVEIVGLTTK